MAGVVNSRIEASIKSIGACIRKLDKDDEGKKRTSLPELKDKHQKLIHIKDDEILEGIWEHVLKSKKTGLDFVYDYNHNIDSLANAWKKCKQKIAEARILQEEIEKSDK